jgi:hypothetical protein
MSLVENYSWVDRLLESKYYAYALELDNIEDYMEAGLLGFFKSDDDALLERKWAHSQIDDDDNTNMLCFDEIDWDEVYMLLADPVEYYEFDELTLDWER